VDMDATSAAGGSVVPRRLARAALGAALLGLVGCLGDSGFANDPLTNGPPMPRNPTASAATARGATAGAPAPLPAVGGPPNSTSPAALAVGAQTLADEAPALRIAGGTAETGGWRGEGGTQPVKLGGPEPDGGAVPAVQPAVPAASVPAQPRLSGPQAVGALGIDSYEAAQKALADRGVSWQRLETVGDLAGGQAEWKFSCSIPDKKNPGIHQRVETRAPGEHGVAAMRLAVQEIDKEQQQ
jgi:hypothetical protein